MIIINNIKIIEYDRNWFCPIKVNSYFYNNTTFQVWRDYAYNANLNLFNLTTELLYSEQFKIVMSANVKNIKKFMYILERSKLRQNNSWQKLRARFYD